MSDIVSRPWWCLGCGKRYVGSKTCSASGGDHHPCISNIAGRLALSEEYPYKCGGYWKSRFREDSIYELRFLHTFCYDPKFEYQFALPRNYMGI
jgi:hypothetical protein